MASRILGMGDVLSLIEKAEEQVAEDEAEELERKIRKAEFTLEDFLKQLKQVRKMGPLQNVLGMMPGMGKAMKQIRSANVDERELDRLEAIILSMTPEERAQPGGDQGLAAQADRARARARTSQAVNNLVKQFDQMRKMMKQIASGKMGTPRRCCGGRSAPGAGASGPPTDFLSALTCRAAWQYESDSDAWVPTRTRSGASSSPTGARRATAARSRRSARTTRRPSRRRSWSTRSAPSTGSTTARCPRARSLSLLRTRASRPAGR